MTTEAHFILGHKIQIYKRPNSNFWQCATSIEGRRFRKGTGQDSYSLAKEVAEDWYFELRGKKQAGILPENRKKNTFREAAEKFMEEYQVMTQGQRSPKWVQGHGIRLRVHLNPFFGDMPVSQITTAKVQEYRIHRMKCVGVNPPESKSNRPPKMTPPSRSTLHDEICTLRLVLRTAVRHEWIVGIPDLSPPYRGQGKVSHRAWFSPAEYKQLYTATRDAEKKARPQHRWNAEQLHDYVLFMANTGLRPDEARNLQHRDVEIEDDDATGERILVIEVRGKRGVGYCKSTIGAVLPYERLFNRVKPLSKNPVLLENETAHAPKSAGLPKPEDHVFPSSHVKHFNRLLKQLGLKHDRDGNARTAYSLRHTYICLRLMEGADIYQIAKNCRTSVEMIQKYYAPHIKNTLDAAAINVRKPRKKIRSK